MHILLLAAFISSITPVQPSQPNRQPQLASSPGLTAVVFASGNSIWISTSHDNGRTFAAATEVARVPALALGRHRGPRVVLSGKTILVAAVYGETVATGPHAYGLPSKGDLVAWRSEDGGRSWSKPVVINDVSGSAREGLDAIAVGEHGEMAAVWLDLRSPGTRLYGAYSEDGGATWSRNVLIYHSPSGTICECCAPSITSAGRHRFEVMFRNVLHGARDLYLADWNLFGHISPPLKLGTGTWKIDACPMDGGGIAWLGGKTITAWRREKTVYLDRPGQPEKGLGEGRDVALALSSKGAYVAWSGRSGIEIHRPGKKQPVCLSAEGGFPALTTLPNGAVLAAWGQGGSIRLRIVP